MASQTYRNEDKVIRNNIVHRQNTYTPKHLELIIYKTSITVVSSIKLFSTKNIVRKYGIAG